MKRISIILIVALVALSMVISCGPTLEKQIVGTWVKLDSANNALGDKIVIKEDSTYEILNEDSTSGTEIVQKTGTWEIIDEILTINIIQSYNSETSELEDIGEGDTQKLEIPISVDEDYLSFMPLLGGNTKTLVGTWEATQSLYLYGETTPEFTADVRLVLNSDNTGEILTFNVDEPDPITDWTYDGSNLTITYNVDSELSFDVAIVGNGLCLLVPFEQGDYVISGFTYEKQ
jgi:hypothetical protein